MSACTMHRCFVSLTLVSEKRLCLGVGAQGMIFFTALLFSSTNICKWKKEIEFVDTFQWLLHSPTSGPAVEIHTLHEPQCGGEAEGSAGGRG